MSSATEEALKAEIARLTGVLSSSGRAHNGYLTLWVGAINRHRAGQPSKPFTFTSRSNAYVNPNYKPPSRAVWRASLPPQPSRPVEPPSRPLSSSGTRDVLIDGVAFQSSGRSLIRKDRA